MQLMQHKQAGQSEASESLVKGIPVKERLNLSEYAKPKKSESNPFHQAKLDLEIATYWLLSKYVQTKRRHAHHLTTDLK